MGTILIALLMALWPHSNSQQLRSFKAECAADETAVQLKCMKGVPGKIPSGSFPQYFADGHYWECKHFQHENKPEWTVDAQDAGDVSLCEPLVSGGGPVLHPEMVCQVDDATCPYTTEQTKEKKKDELEARNMWENSKKSKAAKLEKDSNMVKEANTMDGNRKKAIKKQRDYLRRKDLDNDIGKKANNEAIQWIKQFRELFKNLYGDTDGDIECLNDFRSSRIPPEIATPDGLNKFVEELYRDGNSRELWSMVAKFPTKYYWYWDVISVWYYRAYDGEQNKKNTKKKWEQIQDIVDEDEIKRRVEQMEDVSGFEVGDIFETFGVDFKNTDGDYYQIQGHLGNTLAVLPVTHPQSSVSYARSLDKASPYRTSTYEIDGGVKKKLFQSDIRWQEKHTIYPELSERECEYLKTSPSVSDWMHKHDQSHATVPESKSHFCDDIIDGENIDMQSGMTQWVLNEKSMYTRMFTEKHLLSINGPSGNMDAMLDAILLFKDRDLFLTWWGTAQYLGNAPDHSLGEFLIASQNTLFRDKVFVGTWNLDWDPQNFLDDELKYREWIEEIAVGIYPAGGGRVLTEWVRGKLRDLWKEQNAKEEKGAKESVKESKPSLDKEKSKQSVTESWNDLPKHAKEALKQKGKFESGPMAIV